jgi:uncharacterized membrane protein (UPF0127 family)
MKPILPQQELLLEMLVMSGDIAVTSVARDSRIWKTLEECRRASWVTVVEVSPGVHSASVTKTGRAMVKLGA